MLLISFELTLVTKRFKKATLLMVYSYPNLIMGDWCSAVKIRRSPTQITR